MLDLSSAFDSVVHELLMTRLEQSFDVTDKTFARLKSYITNDWQTLSEGRSEKCRVR